MSSRSSRTSARGEGGSVKKERAPSPLSPIKINRTEEKRQLGLLNNRLAAYIERVRELELANSRLEKQVTTVEETNSREVVSIKGSYDKELALARAALDETSLAKAKSDMEAEKLRSANKDMQRSLNEKESDVGRLSRSVKNLEADNAVLRAQNNDFNDELRSIKPELENLKNKLEDARQKLEDETIKRVQLQNQIQTMEEENKFNQEVLTQQLNESKTRRMIDIEEVDSRAQANYEEKLASSLQELRDAYETQMAENKKEFTQVYDRRLDEMRNKLVKERESATSSTQELKEMTTKMEGMVSRMNELEVTNNALQRRVNELTDQLNDISKKHRADIAQKESEIELLNDQITSLNKDYQDLLDIKIALDIEIANYRNLMDAEESRLAMSPVPGRGVKRRRVETEESYVITEKKLMSTFSQPGPLFIEPLDEEESNVKVTNTGDQEMTLSGMQLKMTSGGVECQYKFTRSHKVAPGATITVWSSDSDASHSVADGQLVMRSGAWPTGEEKSVVLINKEGEEVASREVVASKETEGSSRSFSGVGGGSVLAARQAEEKCCIM